MEINQRVQATMMLIADMKQEHIRAVVSVSEHATGLSHWVYDYLKFKKMDANKKLNDSFQNQEVC